MIVRHFLQWARTAPAAARADATSALARAYLYSDLSPDDRAAAEGAMIMLLDDPSPLVRSALAQALAGSAEAPPAVVFALASDQVEIAAIIVSRSPLLLDTDLVDIVGGADPALQGATAGRRNLPCAVAAAIAEVGTAEACLILIENAEARIAPFSFDRIVERHGHLGAIREALMERDDLPPATRQALVVKLSATLATFICQQQWMDEGRAQRIAKEACEKATIALAADTPGRDVRPLVAHLRHSGQLTAGLMLRALLSGNTVLFEEALAELANVPLARVCGIVNDRAGTGLRALYEQAGLPPAALPAVRAALQALGEQGFVGEPGGPARLKRRMVERVLTACEEQDLGADAEHLLMLLRRFATEAARDEARRFCDDLVAA
ncbi:MAG: DUF2336 domain-containing protein [Variibacter sp.]|nr:DUF2336 domain-containing protein [Variibacter sp.]